MTPQEVLLALRCHQSAIETGRCPKEQCPAFERPARFKCAGTVAKAAADLIEEQAADGQGGEKLWNLRCMK